MNTEQTTQTETDIPRPWDDTPKLTTQEAVRLQRYAASGKTLGQFLSSGAVTKRDLKLIIIMEYTLNKRCRQYILDKCFARLSKMERFEAENSLMQLMLEARNKRTC